MRESRRGNLRFFDCILSKSQRDSSKERLRLLHELLVEILADLILTDCECSMVRKLVKEIYNYTSDEDLERACRFVGRNLQTPLSADRFHHKSRIMSRLLEFLQLYDEMVLEGFIRFRLKDYVEELEEAVERAVDDYLVEREYQEFIALLQRFIDSQETKFHQVHVVPDAEDGYRLVDEDDRSVDCQYVDDLKLVLATGGLEYEDLVISSLVILAPKQVVMHLGNGSRPVMADTLAHIFDDRYRECKRCDRCEENAPVRG